MSIWSPDYVKCRECTFSKKKEFASGKVIYICGKNGSQNYGCELGSKTAETTYLFQNYKRRKIFV